MVAQRSYHLGEWVAFLPVIFQLFCRPGYRSVPAEYSGTCSHHRSQNGYFTVAGGVPLQPNGMPGDTTGPWQRPAFGTFGNAARNSRRGLGFFQADVSVEKMFST